MKSPLSFWGDGGGIALFEAFLKNVCLGGFEKVIINRIFLISIPKRENTKVFNLLYYNFNQKKIFYRVND